MNEWRQAAFISANLMNLQTKKRITVDDLLGLKKKSSKKTRAEIQAELAYLKEKFPDKKE